MHRHILLQLWLTEMTIMKTILLFFYLNFYFIHVCLAGFLSEKYPSISIVKAEAQSVTDGIVKFKIGQILLGEKNLLNESFNVKNYTETDMRMMGSLYPKVNKGELTVWAIKNEKNIFPKFKFLDILFPLRENNERYIQKHKMVEFLSEIWNHSREDSIKKLYKGLEDSTEEVNEICSFLLCENYLNKSEIQELFKMPGVSQHSLVLIDEYVGKSNLNWSKSEERRNVYQDILKVKLSAYTLVKIYTTLAQSLDTNFRYDDLVFILSNVWESQNVDKNLIDKHISILGYLSYSKKDSDKSFKSLARLASNENHDVAKESTKMIVLHINGLKKESSEGGSISKNVLINRLNLLRDVYPIIKFENEKKVVLNLINSGVPSEESKKGKIKKNEPNSELRFASFDGEEVTYQGKKISRTDFIKGLNKAIPKDQRTNEPIVIEMGPFVKYNHIEKLYSDLSEHGYVNIKTTVVSTSESPTE